MRQHYGNGHECPSVVPYSRPLRFRHDEHVHQCCERDSPGKTRQLHVLLRRYTKEAKKDLRTALKQGYEDAREVLDIIEARERQKK